MRRIAAATVLVVLAGAALTAPAYAIQFSVSTDPSILWASLRVTTGPGVTVTSLGTSKQTQVLHFFDSNQNSHIFANPTSPNWDPLLYDEQVGGLTTFGEATANSLSAGMVWSAYPPSGRNSIFVEREGSFQVTGSGTVTFAIDYSLAANRSIDTSSLPYPYIETHGGVEAALTLSGPHVYLADQHFTTLPNIRGSVNDSISQTGTATVQLQLSDGTYRIRASSNSALIVAAPEPSTLLLFVTSLAALGALFGARFLRDRYAARTT
jgi:hypothetical protein